MIIKGTISDFKVYNNDRGTFYRVSVIPSVTQPLTGFAHKEPVIGSDCVCSVKDGRIIDIDF